MRLKTRDRFHDNLFSWYDRNGRRLPWRRTRNPYRVLLSEIMLQQTQVSRVLVKYPAFLQRFPDIETLAAARRSDVVLAWQGMGYNNRAVRLHTLARTVCSDYDGALPSDFDSLISLPGVGRYTANAVLSSAFRRNVPIVDTNVHRVLSRVRSAKNSVTDRDSVAASWKIAASLIPSERCHDWNQALMDLGATVCVATTPLCPGCPVNSVCRSAGRLGAPLKKGKRAEPSFHGIPNRVYRGRIVEILRGRRIIAVTSLGKLLRPAFSRSDKRWLNSLLAALQNDGLVRLSGRRANGPKQVRLA